MARRYRKLKRLRVREVSLVDKPAYTGATVLMYKNAATIDGLMFANAPEHPWVHVEPVESGTALEVVATGIVMAAGDPKPEGGTYNADAVRSLYELWARKCASDKGQRLIRNTKGELSGEPDPNYSYTDSVLVSWGMTDKAGLVLHAAGDHELPADSWYVQLYVSGKTAKTLVGDKRRVNGLAPVGAAIYVAKTDDGPTETVALLPNGFTVTTRRWRPGIDPEPTQASYGHYAPAIVDDTDDDGDGDTEVDVADLGAELADAVREAATDPDTTATDYSASQLGQDIAAAVIEQMRKELHQ